MSDNDADAMPLFRHARCPECPKLQAQIELLQAEVASVRAELEIARNAVIELSTPARRMSRSNDPETSAEAAEEAAKAARKVAAAVKLAMADGIDRNDEEILLACQTRGYQTSPDRIRHGRKALVYAGYLIATGKTRLTSRKKPSKTWIATESVRPNFPPPPRDDGPRWDELAPAPEMT